MPKGLNRVEENPDLYVGYQAVVNLEKGVNSSAWGTRGGPGGWGLGGLDSGTVTGQNFDYFRLNVAGQPL